MNILYYVEPKLYPYFGGVSNVAYYLVKALAKKVNVTYYPRFIPKKSCVMRFFDVYRKFTMKKFDIIHFNVPPGWKNGSFLLLKLARLSGTPKILNIHGIIPIENTFRHKQPRSISHKGLLNTLSSCKVVDRIVVNSEYMRRSVVTWYGAAPNKIVVIPNGVNVMQFSECGNKKILNGDPAILYLGLIHKIKGVDILIEAVAKLRTDLPNMKLHLVGHGYINELKLLAKKKGIEDHVVLYGPAPHSTVARYYNSAGICVFPSRHEAFGITILEAMASGTPIIASNIGGIPEIISSGNNGLLFKPEDADALSKAILALSQDLDLRKRISYNALKTAEKYSWENIAEKYISLYRYLCK